MTTNRSPADGPAPTGEGGPNLERGLRLAVMALAVLALAVACVLLLRGRPAQPTPVAATVAAPRPGAVTLGIAYGTEKERWLKSAAEQFSRTPQGLGIDIHLIPMGSVEGAQAIVRGDDGAKQINVWSPASSVYRSAFEQDWQVKYGNTPIIRAEPLALTPMVFVCWDERYQAFSHKFGEVSFQTIGQALAEKGGWDALASKPEWGLFKFGHTHPNKSNSGLMTLVLMAYDYHQKTSGLTLKDVLDPGFEKWMERIERSTSGMGESTGTMMREMVLKGPSSYDAMFVYENVAIDYLKNAEGRWGRLHIVYPRYNAWNDNPYCILDAPWSSAAQKQAAAAFLDFLLSEPIQRQALDHGFRPANPAVPMRFPESPFVQYAPYGIAVDLTTVCEAPSGEVVNNLLASWQRTQAGR